MPMLINNAFTIQSGIYEPPSTNASGIFYAKEDTHIEISITPDAATYNATYGAYGAKSNTLLLYYNTSLNANLAGGTATHLASWHNGTGLYTYNASFEVKKGYYFNFYFAFYKQWTTTTKHSGWYRWKYRTWTNTHYHNSTSTSINVANFNFNLLLK